MHKYKVSFYRKDTQALEFAPILDHFFRAMVERADSFFRIGICYVPRPCVVSMRDIGQADRKRCKSDVWSFRLAFSV